MKLKLKALQITSMLTLCIGLLLFGPLRATVASGTKTFFSSAPTPPPAQTRTITDEGLGAPNPIVAEFVPPWADATPAISGVVTYGNAMGAPNLRFVSNAYVSGDGSIAVFTQTKAPGPNAGTYTLTGFGAGPYTVTPFKTTEYDSSFITSYDAALILQHVAGLKHLADCQESPADTSHNGKITSYDAALVGMYALGKCPCGMTGSWDFIPLDRTYASVTGIITDQDYSAMLNGEVSGNWINPGPTPVEPRGLQPAVAEDIGSMNGPVRTTAVSAPYLVITPSSDVIVPVTIQGTADKGIISYQFALRYDPSVIQPQADPVDLYGTVSRGFMSAVNAAEPGVLRVVVYGAMPLDGNGVLVNLHFTAVGAPGSVSPLTLEKMMFNEGDPGTYVTDGQVVLSAATPN